MATSEKEVLAISSAITDHAYKSSSSGSSETPKKPVGRPPKPKTPPPLGEHLDGAGSSVKIAKEKKKVEQEAQDKKDEEERVSLIRRVNAYLDSKVWGRRLQHLNIPSLKGNETLDRARESYNRIQGAIGMKYKRLVVDQMFFMGADGIAFVGRNLFALEHFKDLPAEYKEHKDEFEEELSAIAIELDDKWVPRPELRLIMRMIGFAKDYHEAVVGSGSEHTVEPPASSSSSSTRNRNEKREHNEEEEEDEDYNMGLGYEFADGFRGHD